MLRLVLDTAVAACSAALFDGDRLLAARDEIIGRGHAERLVPLIAELMAESGVRRVGSVWVDVGPGSFTGIRVGIAAARAFGMAWGAEVTGYNSTALVAATARAETPAPLLVALEAGRGELYCQRFDADRGGPIEALSVPAALMAATGRVVAGSGADILSRLDPALVTAAVRWPSARETTRLAPCDAERAPRPLYVRAPDAKLPT